MSNLPTADALRTRLADLLTEHRVPGAALGVRSGDDVVEVAAGVTNVRSGVEATPDSVFQIGSITKVWTATVIMQLVDEGRLDIDAPVRTYLPAFKVADADVSAAVTLRHLLTHTSGIEGDHFEDCGRGDDCLERYVESCAVLEQTHAMGATMSYCNTGFNVLGRMIEVVTGTTWDEAMAERVFRPLGLAHTGTLPEHAILHRAASGHFAEGDDAPQVVPVWGLPRTAGPAGLINSTVGDVLTFARRQPSLLSTASAAAMLEPQVDVPDTSLASCWGLGWMLFDWDGASHTAPEGSSRVHGHDGGTLGQAAFLRLAPEADVAICLLTNGGNAAAVYRTLFGELLSDLAGITMPPLPEVPANDARPDIDLARYAGTYERLASRFELRVEDGELRGTVTVTGPLAKLLPTPQTDICLQPVDATTFLAHREGQPAPLPAVFYDFDADGAPRGLHTGARANPRTS